MTHKSRWQDGINLVCGIWLFMSPYTLGYTSDQPAVWTSYITGLLVIGLAITALRQNHRWQEWTFVGIAALLFLSPFVLGFAYVASATANCIFTSLIIGMDALWLITQGPQEKTA